MKELKQSKIGKKSYDDLAAFCLAELNRRQTSPERKALEKTWKEIDRQVEMIPADVPRESWHPEFELPFQSMALEILVADTDHMRFTQDGKFFKVMSERDEESLVRFEKDIQFLGKEADGSVFSGSQNDLDAVMQALLMHAHSKYRIRDVFAQLDAEAMKYGICAAKVHGVKRHDFQNQFGGVTRDDKILPVIVPISVKHFYPDDLEAKALGRGLFLRPMQQNTYQLRAQDISMAMNSSEGGMESASGGWLKKHLSDINPEKNSDLIELLESEGDFVIGSGKDEIFAPNLIVTTAHGKGVEKPTVIRIQENPYAFQSIFFDTYFKNGVKTYGTSPLMKGESLQKMAQSAAEDTVQVSKLNAKPPLSVNMQDPMYIAKGVDVAPGAIWGTAKAPTVNALGDIGASSAVFSSFATMWQETTGVSKTRAGAQTKSHQTASAVRSEANQGQSRTVKYVQNSESGFVSNMLQAEMAILRKSLTAQSIYVPEFNGYVTISKDSVPDNVTFIVRGSSTNAADQQQLQARTQTLQGIIALEQPRVAAGGRPLDLDKVVGKSLAEVYPDSEVEEFFKDQPAPAQPVGPDGQPLPAQAQPQAPPGIPQA